MRIGQKLWIFYQQPVCGRVWSFFTQTLNMGVRSFQTQIFKTGITITSGFKHSFRTSISLLCSAFLVLLNPDIIFKHLMILSPKDVLTSPHFSSKRFPQYILIFTGVSSRLCNPNYQFEDTQQSLNKVIVTSWLNRQIEKKKKTLSFHLKLVYTSRGLITMSRFHLLT